MSLRSILNTPSITARTQLETWGLASSLRCHIERLFNSRGRAGSPAGGGCHGNGRKNHAYGCVRGASLLGALFQGSALAQEAGGEGLDEIIVTAEKREASLRDTPISVSVVGADTLTATQTVNFDQLARMTPNLLIEDSLGASSVSVTNRGVRTVGSQAGFESSTAIVIDGVYQARPVALAMALSDVERIEVLRGPQGALYGRNASAGVLNIVTQAPTADYSAYGEGYYGSFEETRVRSAISGAIAESVNARANFYVLRRNAFADAVFAGADDQISQRMGLGLRFDADLGGWNADLILRHFELDDTLNSQTDLFVVTPTLAGFNAFVIGKPVLNDSVFARRNDQDFQGFENVTHNEVILNLSRDFGGISLESITGYSQYDSSGRIDADNTSASGVIIGSDERHQQFSEELRLRGAVGERLDYLLGAYVFFQDFDHSEPIILGQDWATYLLGAPFLAGAEDNVFSQQETRDLALFGQVSWAATDSLTFRGGARIDVEDKDYNRVQPASFLSPALNASLSRSAENWSGSVAAIYQVSPDANIYASVNRGVKSGGFNFGAAGAASDIPFSEESAVNYELGWRADMFDRRLRLSATAFISRFSDLQVTSFDGTSFLTQNAAEAESNGFEFETSGRLSEGLEVGASVGYLDAKYSRYRNAQCAATDPNAGNPACVQDLSGRPLAYAPEWSGNVYIDANGPLAGAVRWGARADVSYRSAYFLTSSLDPNSRQDGYSLVNLRLGVANPEAGWDIALVANNAFDQDYLQAFFNYPFFAGAYTAQAGQPALYGIVLRQTFN
ncbi:MAG: TonB-dependent receptor [Parvularculaceae bacterium]